MTKKPYRNAQRSRRLIQQAFLQLLQEKELEKITVVDVVTRADLSRNTFYTHYPDIYAILEEYQNTALAQLSLALNETLVQTVADPLPLLLDVVRHVEENQNAYRILLRRSPLTASFIAQLRSLLLQHVNDQLSELDIRDEVGFRAFLEILASGFVGLVVTYLREESELTLPDIAHHLQRIFLAALPLYR